MKHFPMGKHGLTHASFFFKGLSQGAMPVQREGSDLIDPFALPEHWRSSLSAPGDVAGEESLFHLPDFDCMSRSHASFSLRCTD